ncbi:MAG: DNA recombination protein RmuC [Candidatus Pacebacteria bacterium]|nr:DNA recombination protein RmuC [Candidatus Paceibacterota bacterium]MDD3918952.1 DNA recombination protein RmuC [Candidatus Paceibacterota bacterium]
MTTELIVLIFIGLIIIISFYIFFKKLKTEREILFKQFDLKQEIIDGKKDYIKELTDQIRRELEKSQKEIAILEKDRIGEFSSLKTILEEHKILTKDLKESTDGLKNVLSNNQKRGRYGEEIAEELLKSVGFVKGENYIANTALETNSNRPDFTIFLPDKTKINVDVKFPLSALLKYEEAKDKQEKERYLNEFKKDVREKIRQASSRDYINPEEKTVDFVILFIPNEMIFSFIYDKLYDVWQEAMNKKVVLAGPFSFTAMIRMIFQSYKNFVYQENLYEIVKLIKLFEQEYEKYNKEFNVLGDKILSVSKKYDEVSITRTKKLNQVIEKIKGESALEDDNKLE